MPPKSRRSRGVFRLALPLVIVFVLLFVAYAWAVAPPEAEEPPISAQGISAKPLPVMGQAVVCDYFIANGLIVDGSGALPYTGNLAIKGDEIVDVGQCFPAPGAIVIDAQGKIIAPGFIDIHTHSDDYWPRKAGGAMVLAQGVTTHIVGNCGTSTENISAYLSAADGAAVNVGTFLGYKALRRAFISDGAAVTPQVLEQMKARLAGALDNGALGFSLGLSYYPQNKADYEEVLALAKVVESRNSLLSVHIRDEYDEVIPAVEEAIALARESGVRLQYSHIKVGEERNWHKQERVLELLDQVVAEGLDIKGDVYVYPYSSWDLGTLHDSVSVENIKKILVKPYVAVGSDTGINRYGGVVHPRAYGNATAVLCRYVRDEALLTLEEAVMKMTSLPAEIVNLPDRGLLAKGKKADIVVFALEDLKEHATRSQPAQLSEGMHYVFVNGEPAIKEGAFTQVLAGQALRGNK